MTHDWMPLYNSHLGETCIVIGNGPSLKDVPDELLRKYPTFGTNRIYLRQGFTPTYYVCVNPLVREQFHEEIFALPCLKFMGGGPDVAPGQGVLNLHSAQVRLFSYAPDQWIYEGYTVTFVALQLAYFMGFTKVGLVGIDHRYIFDGVPNEERIAETAADPNHFDPTYFTGVRWNNPDLNESTVSYQIARMAFDGVRRELWNLTPNSALEVLEMGNIGDWL